jgi:S-adenosylmethionine decarboxylase
MEIARDALERTNHGGEGLVGAPPSMASTEWLIDAANCDRALLSDREHLQRTCDAVVAGLALRVIGTPLWHRFPACRDSAEPGGVTGLYLLAESHLTCHTFPEDRLATFNLYCCRGRAAWDWQGFLRERLGASVVVVRSVGRGLPVAELLTGKERP